MENKDTFYLDEDGKTITCHIITTMFSEIRKKHYVIYETDENNDEIYVSSFDPTGEEGELFDIVDEEELNEIKNFLEDYGD